MRYITQLYKFRWTKAHQLLTRSWPSRIVQCTQHCLSFFRLFFIILEFRHARTKWTYLQPNYHFDSFIYSLFIDCVSHTPMMHVHTAQKMYFFVAAYEWLTKQFGKCEGKYNAGCICRDVCSHAVGEKVRVACKRPNEDDYRVKHPYTPTHTMQYPPGDSQP